MNVLRAGSAGFCLGVSLALKRLDREINAHCPAEGGRLITFGPIIHNPLVMQSYAAKGVECLSDPAAILERDRVVIRAHGIPKTVQKQLAATGATLADATCPKVKKAQLGIAKASKNGDTLLLFGEADHPEVKGLVSYAEGPHMVFGSLQELAALKLDPGISYFLAAQTTQERDVFAEAQKLAQERLGRKIPVLQTICDATRHRQDGIKALGEQVQAIVVVGGLNSGNTRRLAEVATTMGLPTVHVEQASDITPEQIHMLTAPEINTIGLTAGASTPDEHIEAMERFITALQPKAGS